VLNEASQAPFWISFIFNFLTKSLEKEKRKIWDAFAGFEPAR